MPSSPEPGPPLVASFVADLPADMDAGEVVRLHIDHLGAPYLVADRTEAEIVPTWRLTEVGEWSFRAIPSNGLRHLFAAPLPDDLWLVVGGTSRIGTNARVVDVAGTVTREFRVGDAILDIQATASCSAWVSYFDEGVFGDDLGQAGLLGFDLSGNITFSFANLQDVPPIDDCYALNVVSDREQWTCYYSDFPIVQIIDGKLGGLWEEVAPAGANAFAVAPPRLLFGPGYERGDLLTLVDLETGRRSTHPVLTDEGRQLQLARHRDSARGSTFLISDEASQQLYSVDLARLGQ